MIDVKGIEKELDFDWCMNQIRPITPYGVEYKKAMKPYPVGTEEQLSNSLEALESYVNWYKEADTVNGLTDILSSVKDVRFSIKRAEEGQILSEVELYEIKALVFLIDKLNFFRKENGLPEFFNTKVTPLPTISRLLNPKGSQQDTFYIYDTYSFEIAALRGKRSETENQYRRELRALKKRIKEEYEIVLSGDNTIITQKSDEDFRKRIEACPYLAYASETYNNLVFSLRLPEEVLSLREEADRLKELEEEEEERIRGELSEQIGEKAKALLSNIHAVATLDLYLAKARFALEIHGVKPEIKKTREIIIRKGRHPKIEAALKEKKLEFTPITIDLKPGVTCITGANMGGKTISLKLVGLLVLMAQYGLYVPAEYMETGLQEYIVTSIGDMQSTDSGLSTFGGEIANVVEAMEFADEPGIILIDELARGTNPIEGYAISLAIVEHLKKKSAITLLTTHFDRVTQSSDIKHLQVVGLSKFDFETGSHRDVEENLKILNKYMDYRLVEVSKYTEVPKDAINIAKIMGLPEEVVAYAEETVKNGW